MRDYFKYRVVQIFLLFSMLFVEGIFVLTKFIIYMICLIPMFFSERLTFMVFTLVYKSLTDFFEDIKINHE